MRSLYAIINPASESVGARLERIDRAIVALGEGLGVTIHRTPIKELDCKTGDWSVIDAQLDRARNCDGVAVFGGDGTHAYVLGKLAALGERKEFIGIRCGTMNIGSGTSTLDSCFNFTKTETRELDAIEARVDGGTPSYAFIDAVIATTCVARIDGKLGQISAQKILKGVKEYDTPSPVGSSRTVVKVIRGGKEISLPTEDNLMTVSAAFLTDGLKARVLAGGADPAACSGFGWGFILSDFPLVWADATKETLAARPIRDVFMPLFDTDRVTVSGLLPEAHLVNDGNAVSRGESVEFCLKKKAVTVTVLI